MIFGERHLPPPDISFKEMICPQPHEKKLMPIRNLTLPLDITKIKRKGNQGTHKTQQASNCWPKDFIF